MINLNNLKQTFEKNILAMDISISIIQYDDFISKIKEITSQEIKEAINQDNLNEALFRIFGNEIPSLVILLSSNYVERIKLSYLKTLIDTGILDLYIEDKVIEYSDKVKAIAIDMHILKNINFNSLFINLKVPSLYKKDISFMKAKLFLKNNEIDSDISIRKEELRIELLKFHFQRIELLNLSSFGIYLTQEEITKIKEYALKKFDIDMFSGEPFNLFRGLKKSHLGFLSKDYIGGFICEHYVSDHHKQEIIKELGRYSDFTAFFHKQPYEFSNKAYKQLLLNKDYFIENQDNIRRASKTHSDSCILLFKDGEINLTEILNVIR